MMFKGLKEQLRPFFLTLNIKSAIRLTHDCEFEKLLKKVKPGVVLDIGANMAPYKTRIPFTKYLTLDIDKANNPDICCDVHKIKYASNSFDTIIATHILEHCYDPQKVVNEIHRLLKKSCICILTVPFSYPYHPGPNDYYRFTWDSLKYLFRKFKKVEVTHYGCAVHNIWEMFNTGYRKVFFNIFNPIIGRIKTPKKTACPSGFLVYAIK